MGIGTETIDQTISMQCAQFTLDLPPSTIILLSKFQLDINTVC